MAYRQFLPEDKEQAEEVVKQLIAEGERLRNPRAVKWWMAHYYIKGARNFTNINYQDGSLQIAYTDESGRLNFKYEGIISNYQTQLGRLIGLNLAPAVKQKGISLEGMRKSGVAQAGLNVAFTSDKVDKLKQELIPPLLTYGMVGLGVWVENENSIGIDVIMPWELLPIPPNPPTVSSIRGIARVRYVPLTWAKGLAITPGDKSDIYNEVEKISIPTGNTPSAADSKFQGFVSGLSSGSAFYTTFPSYKSGTSLRKKNETYEDIVKFVEIWLWTPDDYLAEYHVYVGGKQLHKTSFVGQRVNRPIQTVVCIPTCDFYSPSYIDILMPLNQELEYSVGRMFQDVQDWDLYGLLMTPTTAGVPAEIEEGKDGVKRVRFEVDYTSPQPIQPYQIKPAVPNAFIVNAIKLGKDLMNEIANQPSELLAGGAPGRIDSSAAIGTLYELSRIPLSPTAKSIAIGVSGCYKAILGMIRGLWGNDKIIDMTMLDDAVAGVILDVATGQIKLAENALPHPDEVEITIASEAPVSREQQKMEMAESLKSGIITPTEYRIEARKRGLDLPVGSDLEWQNYRRAMMENIILFGDGTKPGSVIVTENDLHSIHDMVLNAFRARPEFLAASDAVREKFANHAIAHEAGMGKYPQMEFPEDAAMVAVQQMQEAGAGALPLGGQEMGGPLG